MQVTVDGDLEDEVEQDCAGGGCSLSRSWSLDPGDFVGGSATIEVVATNFAGQTSSDCFRVQIAGIDSAPGDVPCGAPSQAGTVTHGDDPSDYRAPDDVPAGDVIDGDDGSCVPDPNAADNDCTNGELSDTGASARAVRRDLPPNSGPFWGISDQNSFYGFKPDSHLLLGDKDFKNLPTKLVRLVLPYDFWSQQAAYEALTTRDGSPDPFWNSLDKTLGDAHSGGYRVLVSFTTCRTQSSCNTDAPAVSTYRAAVRAFLDHYSWIQDFTSWNEPNRASNQPTHDNPYRAGEYWHAMHVLCKSRCRVGAGDFLDSEQFLGDYFKSYRRGMQSCAPYWALHAYWEGKYGATEATGKQFTYQDKFDQAITPKQITADCPSPQIWLTEQGAYKRQYSSRTKKTRFYTSKEMNRNTNFLLDQVAHRDPRTTKSFYYSMRGSSDFDTGLTSYTSPYKPRPNYYLVKKKFP